MITSTFCGKRSILDCILYTYTGDTILLMPNSGLVDAAKYILLPDNFMHVVAGQLSWLERRANNANVMGSSPILASSIFCLILSVFCNAKGYAQFEE